MTAHRNQSPRVAASGIIFVSTFVALDPSNPKQVLQCGANATPIGIAQVNPYDAPGLTGSSAAAAYTAGQLVDIFGLGDISLLKVGAGGWTTNDLLISDSLGNGVTLTGDGTAQHIGAIALENGAAGEYRLVQIVIFDRGLVTSSSTSITLSGATLTFNAATGSNSILLVDNLADALSVAQSTNKYLTFVTTDGSEATNVKAPAATAVTNAGGAINVTAGTGGTTSGTGGAVTGAAGAGGAGASVGTGGAVSWTGGASTGSGAGGAASLIGGAGGLVSTGGACVITGGAGGATSGAGGAVTITGGASAGTSGAGGATSMIGGAGIGASAGGLAKIVGGLAGTTGVGGGAQVTGGAGGATSGNGGVVALRGGAGTLNADGGAVTISGGALNGSGANGSVTIQAAYAPVAGGGVSSAILCSSTALVGIYFGTGTPTFSAGKGSLYTKLDATTTTSRLWVATDAVGTWATITTSA